MLPYVKINVQESYRKRTRVRLFLLNCVRNILHVRLHLVDGKQGCQPESNRGSYRYTTRIITHQAPLICASLSRCFLRSESSHVSSVRMRVEEAGCPQLTYLSSSPSQFPIYIALNFGEPSIKPTQVEPEAGAIIASCDGAVNGTEK